MVAFALLIYTVPASAMGVVRGSSPAYSFQEHFKDLPSLSEVRVGDRQFKIEKVVNGFLVRDMEDQSAVVLTLADLAAYEIKAIGSGTDGTRFQVVNRSLFGTAQAMELQLASMGSGFRGIVSPREGMAGIEVEFSPLPAANSEASQVQAHAAEMDYVAGDFQIVITIIFSAAALGVVTCAALALIINCSDECSDACNACGNNNGSCHMVGYTEGLCGQCDCRCECSGGGGIFEEHQDGCH